MQNARLDKAWYSCTHLHGYLWLCSELIDAVLRLKYNKILYNYKHIHHEPVLSLGPFLKTKHGTSIKKTPKHPVA